MKLAPYSSCMPQPVSHVCVHSRPAAANVIDSGKAVNPPARASSPFAAWATPTAATADAASDSSNHRRR